MSTNSPPGLFRATQSGVDRPPVRVALVGTGYIAEFHALALRSIPGVELVAVCDTSERRAQSFAAEWGSAAVFSSLEAVVDRSCVDAIHVLTPPDSHFSLTKLALRSGLNVLLEKPICASVEEADEMLEIARVRGLHVGVSHNFLFCGAYRTLRDAIKSGGLGPLDYIGINYFFELKQIRFGPFDSWMLRSPENTVLEIGPHLLSIVGDLVGLPEEVSVEVDRKIDLPGGGRTFLRWRIRATVGRVAVDININLAPGFDQRTIHVRGLFGASTADIDANTCTLDRRTPSGIDFDRFRRSRSQARQLRSQAVSTLGDYVLTKLKLRQRGNPYQLSIIDSVAAFYRALRAGEPLDARIDGAFGRDVIAACLKVARAGRSEVPPERVVSRQIRIAPAKPPTVLVIGAGGFIGRELVGQLLKGGYSVRAMARHSISALEHLEAEGLEIVRADVRSADDIARSMSGIRHVFHLATAETKTWPMAIENVVEPARLVGNACLAAGVERLVYTGTIDSYYAGSRAGIITEQTPFECNMERRNYYARAKAAAEAVLVEMHRSRGLPLVIFRPGIVIGRGGNPFHWGVGRFSENVCEVWGEGTIMLPFVLVADVAAGLIRGIQVPGIEGRSFNLVDRPLLTARDYLQQIERLAGIRLDVIHRPIWQYFLSDLAKWTIKLGVGHPDRIRIPSYRDWESRTQSATFDCSRARTELGWTPAADRSRLIKEGIGDAVEGWAATI
ncbi:1,5-anhydro-D-fructose reductase [Rhodoplanes serenus]|uniref:1,5-anhydro-D-fructose reductase n=2 Tax=Nitrobacteraceae TaxID=41294 RepID=A0A447CU51_9BRAD|nr:1,5-anhydro-D-fructose reductase [Rhodoplanes serenus]